VEGKGKERARSACRGFNLDCRDVTLRRREGDQSCERNAGMRNHADGAIWMGQIFKRVSVGDLDGSADEDQGNAYKSEEQCSSILQAWFRFQAEHKDTLKTESYN
jgi:hypothetical protein